MAEDALEVLRTLVYCEKQIPSKDGRWFSTRIMPYRTFDDRIDGLVITFINITPLKQIENRIAENEQYQHILLNQSANIIVKLSTSGEIIEVNSAAQKYFGSKADEILKRNFTQYIFPEAERKKTEKAIQKLLKGIVDGKIKTQIKTAAGKTHSTEWQVKILQNKLNQATGMVLITENNLLN
jgi:two-component system CheB/CheR fusion protein